MNKSQLQVVITLDRNFKLGQHPLPLGINSMSGMAADSFCMQLAQDLNFLY